MENIWYNYYKGGDKVVKTESIKLKVGLLKGLRELKKIEGQTITWHIERAIKNYFIAKNKGHLICQ